MLQYYKNNVLTAAQAPLGLIIGVSAGGTLLISVALCIIIVLVCVIISRIRVHNIWAKPQSGQLAISAKLMIVIREITYYDYYSVISLYLFRQRGIPGMFTVIRYCRNQVLSSDIVILYPSCNVYSISSDNELVVDHLYDTIPYSDPSEVRTKGGQTHKMEWIHIKGAHIYDKLIYEDAHRPSSSVLNDISAVRNVTKDEIQVLENNDKQR